MAYLRNLKDWVDPLSGSRERRAIVIGGSMSGLITALLLRRTGWNAHIYERVDSELSGRGAGIVVHREFIERLRTLGLPTENLGVHVSARKVFDIDGKVRYRAERAQVMTSWERVFRLLRDAFPLDHYHRGCALVGFTQTADAVSAQFSNGETLQADLLVGADGIRSTVRQQCLPQIIPLYAGYSAWRALIAESAFPAEVRRELFEYMSFGLPPGEQFLGYPVAGPDNGLSPGHRRYNVIWYRPADEETKLPWLLTDESGVRHTISIPPPLIRHAAIAEMRADAERLLALQFRQIVRLIDEPLLQPIYDMESPRMAFGRVAIVGDAAFVARPHVGAGVSKAADDAAALVDALRAEPDVFSALKRFEAARLKENYRIIEQARHLGAFLQATRTEKEQALAGRHSTDIAVLAETAALDFLRA
jgi:2-polyprenyl-6-methoxyphenol hydroxylase-like FAD-dependent oxidoreductase